MKKNEKGLTLVELVVVMAIMGIIMAVIMAVFRPVYHWLAKTMATREQEILAINTARDMNNELSFAKEIIVDTEKSALGNAYNHAYLIDNTTPRKNKDATGMVIKSSTKNPSSGEFDFDLNKPVLGLDLYGNNSFDICLEKTDLDKDKGTSCTYFNVAFRGYTMKYDNSSSKYVKDTDRVYKLDQSFDFMNAPTVTFYDKGKNITADIGTASGSKQFSSIYNSSEDIYIYYNLPTDP